MKFPAIILVAVCLFVLNLAFHIGGIGVGCKYQVFAPTKKAAKNRRPFVFGAINFRNALF